MLSFALAMTRRRLSTACTRALLGIVCALLLFAQHVGLTHAVWHAAQNLPAHTALADDDSDSSGLPHASKLCPLDAALGQVLGAGPVSGFAFDHLDDGASAPSFAAHAAPSLSVLTPRSRGPPALL
jgi:hypothetical protein